VILTNEILYRTIKDIYFDKSDIKHREFCEWARMHFCIMKTKDLEPEDLGISRLTASILIDIDAQWNLYLANTYLPNILKSLNLDNVKLPRMCFGLWYRQINNESLGHADILGWNLQEEVERKLIDDLNFYRIDRDTLHFDWSESCIKGHSAIVKGGIINNFSDISLVDYSGKVNFNGWIDFIFDEKHNYSLEVYWDFLIGDGIEKNKFGIPNQIWKKIPDKLKCDYMDLHMK
jgi:hypothetical protein